MCGRPGAVGGVLEEPEGAGVSQLIVAPAVPLSPAPHQLRVPRLDVRSRLGDFVAAAEAAALRDAMDHALRRFDSSYVIAPSHNAAGPFDCGGAHDEASDRHHTTLELGGRADEYPCRP